MSHRIPCSLCLTFSHVPTMADQYEEERARRARPFASCRHVLFTCLLALNWHVTTGWSQPKSPPKKPGEAPRNAERWGHGSLDRDGNLLKVRINDATEADLEVLVRTSPKLQMVYISGLGEPMSPRGLRHLENLRDLESLWFLPGLSDPYAEAISRLGGLKDLRLHLHTDTALITERGAIALSRLRRIESLSLAVGFKQFNVADDAIGASVLRQFPHVKRLTLSHSSVSSLTMRELGALRELESLTVRNTTRIEPHDLRHIENLRQLEEMECPMSVTDAWLRHLAPLKSLKRIRFSSRHVTDAGVAHLSALCNIEHLHIGCDRLTDKSLAAFRGMSKLRCLELYSTRINGSGFVHLRGLKQLEKLRFHQIQDPGIQPEHVHHLAQLTNLRHLDVAWTPLSRGENWRSLAVLKDLEHLEIVEVDISPDDTKALKKMLPGCCVYYHD